MRNTLGWRTAFLIFGLLLYNRTLQGADVTYIAQKARPSVMLILVVDASGREVGSGTGFIVSSDGKLVTNHHVARAGANALAKAANGKLYPILGVIAEDVDRDLVIVKIDGRDHQPLSIGSSNNLKPNTPVAMVGNPLGLDGTATEGMISTIHNYFGKDIWIEVAASPQQELNGFTRKIIHGSSLQVITPVTFGSSGSPLLNTKGEVIGVVTAAQGLSRSWAIPSETIKMLLLKSGSVRSLRPLSSLGHADLNGVYFDGQLAAASTAFAVGNYREAEQRLELVLPKYKKKSILYYGLGMTQLKLADVDNAKKSLHYLQKEKSGYASDLSSKISDSVRYGSVPTILRPKKDTRVSP